MTIIVSLFYYAELKTLIFGHFLSNTFVQRSVHELRGRSHSGYVVSTTIRKYTELLTQHGGWKGTVQFSEAILYNFDEREDVVCCYWSPTCGRVHGWTSTSFNGVCSTPSSVNFTAITEVSYMR